MLSSAVWAVPTDFANHARQPSIIHATLDTVIHLQCKSISKIWVVHWLNCAAWVPNPTGNLILIIDCVCCQFESNELNMQHSIVNSPAKRSSMIMQTTFVSNLLICCCCFIIYKMYTYFLQDLYKCSIAFSIFIAECTSSIFIIGKK